MIGIDSTLNRISNMFGFVPFNISSSLYNKETYNSHGYKRRCSPEEEGCAGEHGEENPCYDTGREKARSHNGVVKTQGGCP